MNWKGWTLFGILFALLAAIVAFFMLFRSSSIEPHPVVETPEVGNLEGQSLYASGEYGFTLRYPSAARMEETFSPDYHLGTSWRANAPADSEGTPVLALVVYETESETSYPRYYRTLVRLGVSDEVSNCESVTPNAGETVLPDVTLNGTTWKAFSFQDAGMMQYVKGVSYRVVHEDRCYALEKIAAGSSYREDPDTESDIPDAELETEYATLDAIISTFAFTTP